MSNTWRLRPRTGIRPSSRLLGHERPLDLRVRQGLASEQPARQYVGVWS